MADRPPACGVFLSGDPWDKGAIRTCHRKRQLPTEAVVCYANFAFLEIVTASTTVAPVIVASLRPMVPPNAPSRLLAAEAVILLVASDQFRTAA